MGLLRKKDFKLVLGNRRVSNDYVRGISSRWIIETPSGVSFSFERSDADVQMIVKMCNCHDIPYDVCEYQKKLRKFGLDAYADLLVTEKTVPDWTPQNV